jgi:hypothetical protein
LWYLLQALRVLQNQTTTIHVYSQSCIKIVKNPNFHAHLKHIKMQYHFIWEINIIRWNKCETYGYWKPSCTHFNHITWKI